MRALPTPLLKLMQAMPLYATARRLKHGATRLRLRYTPPVWLARREAARWSVHDEAKRAFYGTFVPASGLVFDIGANIGNRVKVFLALGAEVVAVEPQEECVRALRAAYGPRERFRLWCTAMGAEEGSAEMAICSANTMSSLSTGWLEAVRRTQRFGDTCDWERTRTVPVTTLDALIARYGVPDFIKIDVEGYEAEVVKGLSRPVRALSFEFTPEFFESAEGSVRHLAALGPVEFNFSLGESMTLALPTWLAAEELLETMRARLGNTLSFGDVYARFPTA